LFAPTKNCVKNLGSEGIPKQRIILSGDTMYDAFLQHMPTSTKSDILKKLGLEREEYAALTLHRPENVDTPKTLKNIMKAMVMLKELTIVFPIHPRTKQRLASVKLIKEIEPAGHIKLIEPIGYHDMLQLAKHARIVFTDSGGLQKEAFWLHTPCITLREKTEWTETTELGANILVGSNPQKIVETTGEIMKIRDIKNNLERLKNPFGNGEASQKIVAHILKRR